MCDGCERIMGLIKDLHDKSFNTSSCDARVLACRTKWLRPTHFIIKTRRNWIHADEVNVGRVVLLYSANGG